MDSIIDSPIITFNKKNLSFWIWLFAIIRYLNNTEHQVLYYIQTTEKVKGLINGYHSFPIANYYERCFISLPSVCIWWLLYMSLQKSFSFLLLYMIQMCAIWVKLLVNSNRMIIVCSFAFSIVVCTVMMSWRLLETNWNCMIKELCPNRYHF